MSANAAYLKAIASRLEEIPRAVAIEAAYDIFTLLVLKTVIDSGQAALNWRIESYDTSPELQEQQTFWGTNERSPSGGAGYKAFFSYLGDTGDPDTIYSIAQANAVNAVISLRSRKFSGISVYNPTTPGFYEDDDQYEGRAMRKVIRTLKTNTVNRTLLKAYNKVKIKYRDLLT